MTTEIYWLTLTTLMTGLFWVPYILNRIAVRGLGRAMGNPLSTDAPPLPMGRKGLSCSHECC